MSLSTPKNRRSANTTRQTIRLFWQHARVYPKFWVPLLFSLPATLLLGDFVQPYITAQILSRLSSGDYDPTNLWGSFGTELMLVATAMILSGIIGWRITIWLEWRLSLKVTRDISQRVFSHLMAMSAGFHANRFSGSLVSQASKLTGAYLRLSDATLYSLFTLAIGMLATIVILAPRAPLYVLVLVVLSVAYIIGTVFFSRAVREANTTESQLQSRQTGYLSDSISNIMAVKTFAEAEGEKRRYWELSGRVQRAGLDSMYATIKRENYASFLTTGLGIAALFIAVIGVGALKADVGTIFLIVSYTSALALRLWDFQNVLRQYNRALGDASDMVGILQIEPGIKDPANPEASRIQAGNIALKDMTFTHPENNEALFQDFNLDIKAGEKIGLVGHSGSGKTTLTRLLLRFSDIDSGEISIDGQAITRVTQDDLRRAISYVPQEPLLFHRSLRDNIAYGKPDATDREVEQAARRAHAHEFIEGLPEGYGTLVGERGIKLSGGQRQRIVIARAMLKDAPILVLDEATSALDSESERLIQDALWKLMEGRTAIVIAHRLSTIQHMDRIVVLDKGRIVEQGSHAALLANDGAYARLWAHQTGGFIEEDTPDA